MQLSKSLTAHTSNYLIAHGMARSAFASMPQHNQLRLRRAPIRPVPIGAFFSRRPTLTMPPSLVGSRPSSLQAPATASRRQRAARQLENTRLTHFWTFSFTFDFACLAVTPAAPGARRGVLQRTFGNAALRVVHSKLTADWIGTTFCMVLGIR